MDVGNKTLAQLSEEAKEKRYVSLLVGAKVSGYTKEYLEHLCRLNKVEFCLWGGGQFVIELESLLSETHTILLSYEDINFVDKELLDDPLPQFVSQILTSQGGATGAIATVSTARSEVREKLKQKVRDGITQAIPTFGEINQTVESLEVEPVFARVGRSAVPDSLPLKDLPSVATVTTVSGKDSLPNGMGVASTASLLANETQSRTHLPINSGEEAESKNATASKMHSSFHLRVTGEEISSPQSTQNIPTETTQTITAISQIAAGDSSLITPAVRAFGMRTPSLHPIQTSPLGSLHHDDAPLFPLIQKITEVASLSDYIASDNTEVLPGIPYLGLDSRTVVFSDAVPLATDKAIYHPLFSPNPTSTIPRKSMLPATQREHQLVVHETHSLVRSPVLNIAFIACLLFSTLAIGGFFSGENSLLPKENIATVVNALPADTEPETMSPIVLQNEQQLPTTETFVLPFSDDVIISTSTTPNAVIVQPVFNGVPGQKFEYIIVPVTKTEPRF